MSCDLDPKYCTKTLYGQLRKSTLVIKRLLPMFTSGLAGIVFPALIAMDGRPGNILMWYKADLYLSIYYINIRHY